MSRWAALASTGLAILAGCNSAVQGVGCTQDSDCASHGGICEGTVCVRNEFNALAIDSPQADGNVPGTFEVVATLTRMADGTAKFPDKISLTVASETAGSSETSLALDAGSSSYRGNVTVTSGGIYTLTAKLPRTTLASESVNITANVCSGCLSYQVCVIDTCLLGFSELDILTPADGASLDVAQTEVTAVLTGIDAWVDAEPPETITLTATHDPSLGSDPYTYVLTLVPGTTGYQGTFDLIPENEPARPGGHYTLVARWIGEPQVTPILESDETPVLVTVCPPGCGTYQDCVDGECVSRFVDLTITAPMDGSTVGVSAPVTVHLDRRAGGTGGECPASVTLLATSGGPSATPESVELICSCLTDECTGTWNPSVEGEFQLKAKSVDLGITSDPAVLVTCDKTGPVFNITVGPGPSRANHQTDPSYKNGETPYRRDETAALTVWSADADVDADSLAVIIKGTGSSQRIFSRDQTSICMDSTHPFCRTVLVDLWDPALEMKAFRAEFSATANGSDLVGNPGTAGNGKIQVTRWKWAVDPTPSIVNSIKTAPAIGRNGSIYFGTSTGTAYAVSPDGAWKELLQTDGQIASSIAIGDVDWGNGSEETAFIAGTFVDASTVSRAAIWAIPVVSDLPGVPVPICIGFENSVALASIALTTTVVSAIEQPQPTAIAVFNNSKSNLVAARPLDMGPSRCLWGEPFDYKSPSSTGLAVSDRKVFFGDDGGYVRAFTFGIGGIITSWSVLVGSGNQPTNPIITGAGVAGGGGVGVGTIFMIPFDGSIVINGSTGSPTWNAIELAAFESRAPSILAGTNKESLFMVPETFSSGTLDPIPDLQITGSIVASPAVGSDKSIYIATEGGVLYSLDPSLGISWQVGLGPAVDSSPALDCSRDDSGAAIPGRPGVLYVGADNGLLYAFVVDSRGIDTTAPWPKFHRDPRNTSDGSTGRDLSEFRCPENVITVP